MLFCHIGVQTFDADPHLLHVGLKDRFPLAVINVIVTAIGGESSESGSVVLTLRIRRIGRMCSRWTTGSTIEGSERHGPKPRGGR